MTNLVLTICQNYIHIYNHGDEHIESLRVPSSLYAHDIIQADKIPTANSHQPSLPLQPSHPQRQVELD